MVSVKTAENRPLLAGRSRRGRLSAIIAAGTLLATFAVVALVHSASEPNTVLADKFAGVSDFDLLNGIHLPHASKTATSLKSKNTQSAGNGDVHQEVNINIHGDDASTGSYDSAEDGDFNSFDDFKAVDHGTERAPDEESYDDGESYDDEYEGDQEEQDSGAIPLDAIAGMGNLYCRGIDASTGHVIPDLQYRVQSYDGVTLYRPEQNAHGWWKIDVQAPVDYKIFGNAPDFHTAETSAVVNRDAEVRSRLITVPMPMKWGGVIAWVVLYWDDLRAKLDGTLSTPRCDVHAGFVNRCDDRVVVAHQELAGRGPDTIGIKEFQPGNYYYRVHNVPEVNSFDILARVELFMPDGAHHTFRMERDGFFHGNVWNVFRILNDGIEGGYRQVRMCQNAACRFGRNEGTMH